MNVPAAESDRELLDRVSRTGDSRALAALYVRHRERLMLVIRQRLGRALRARLDSEDILQSAFVDAVRDWPRAPRTDEAFLPWAARVIETTIRDRARRLARGKRNPARETPSEGGLATAAGTGPTPSTAAGRAEDLRALDLALTGLSARDRELVLLARIEGRSAEEVAARLGLSREACKRAITRAVARLAAIMARTSAPRSGPEPWGPTAP